MLELGAAVRCAEAAPTEDSDRTIARDRRRCGAGAYQSALLRPIRGSDARDRLSGVAKPAEPIRQRSERYLLPVRTSYDRDGQGPSRHRQSRGQGENGRLRLRFAIGPGFEERGRARPGGPESDAHGLPGSDNDGEASAKRESPETHRHGRRARDAGEHGAT